MPTHQLRLLQDGFGGFQFSFPWGSRLNNMKKREHNQKEECIRLCVNCGTAYLGRVKCPTCKENTGMQVPDKELLSLLPRIEGDN